MMNARGGKDAAVCDASCPPDEIGHAFHDTNALLLPSFCAFSCFLRAGSGGVMPSSSLGEHRFGLRGAGMVAGALACARAALGWVRAEWVGSGARGRCAAAGIAAFAKKQRVFGLCLLQADPDWRMGEGVVPMVRWVCVFCVVFRKDGSAFGVWILVL